MDPGDEVGGAERQRRELVKVKSGDFTGRASVIVMRLRSRGWVV